MRMYDLIARKRDGKTLMKEEIEYIVHGYTRDEIPDYQISALLMAIYLRGMTDDERKNLTHAMAESGEQIDLSDIDGIKVDKHSTGGVGDTTTLILAPWVASAGVPIAKMSGRGLGHTGGTVDKLESIPGFHIELSKEEFNKRVNENHIAVIGQSGNITPADKKLYSLRDVTATVDSIPLIASSIMSKKIAAGADAIVLDVKVGSGAFMQNINDAKELAHAMVDIGNQLGRKTMALISDMNQPLGYAIGNSLEIQEAIDTLRGKGPADLTELCLELGSQMVLLGGKANSLEEAKQLLIHHLESGKALEKFKTFLSSQGGDVKVVDQPERLPQAKYKIELPALTSGYINEINANELGTAAMMLGAGRKTKDSDIDLAVGIVLHKKVGEEVKKGEPLLTIHSNKDSADEVQEILYHNIKIIANEPKSPKLIHAVITE